jgi:hypothetical protein
MSAHEPKIEYSPYSIQISSGTHPKTLEDLNSFHKDSLYELVTAAREAYLMKHLAGKLASAVTKSSNVRDMSHLIADSAREQERTLRMAACIANAPVSTTYPYLPLMPTKMVTPVSTASTQAPGSPSVPPPAAVPSVAKQGLGNAEVALLTNGNLRTRPLFQPLSFYEFI